MNKRGWIHILEATIAVMIVAGVMMTFYSDQSARGELSLAEYSYGLQSEILDSIVIRSDLRMDVLRVAVDDFSDPDFDKLNSIVAAEIPDSFGHWLRVCSLDDPCNMPEIIFKATVGKNIFVEEAIVTSELGDGDETLSSPKKVRLFFWEGDVPEESCYDECEEGSVTCSIDFRGIVTSTCEDSDEDGCLERSAEREDCSSDYVCDADSVVCEYGGCSDTCSPSVSCSGGDVWGTSCVTNDGDCLEILSSGVTESCGGLGCFEGVCNERISGYRSVCEKKVIVEEECVVEYRDQCDAYDGGEKVRDDECVVVSAGTGLVFTFDGEVYQCWDIIDATTDCESSPPGCSKKYTFVRDESCFMS